MDEEDIEYVRALVTEERPHWPLYYEVFRSVMEPAHAAQYRGHNDALRERYRKESEPSPTYPWKPHSEMYTKGVRVVAKR